MIKNIIRAVLVVTLVGGVAVAAARYEPPQPEQRPQGVVEFEERDLSFELPGRVTSVKVKRGDDIQPDQLIATLDDSLERTAREVRQSDATSAQSQVELLKSGARSEDVAALAAEVVAARATEDRLSTSLERERKLQAEGVTPQSAIDDLEGQLATAKARRQAVQHRLASLRQGARKQDVSAAEARVAALEAAVKLEQQRIERRELRAKFAGTVLDVHVEDDEVVGGGTPIVTVADPQRPYVDAFVPVGELEGLKLGVGATVHVDSTNQIFAARVEHIARRTEFTPRYIFSERERANLVVRVRVRIDDPEQALHAGIPAFVVFER